MNHQQQEIADRLNAFCEQYGLKKQYIAQCCEMNPTTLASFCRHKLVIANYLAQRIVRFMEDYEARMQ